MTAKTEGQTHGEGVIFADARYVADNFGVLAPVPWYGIPSEFQEH